jgi:hypothetical protein
MDYPFYVWIHCASVDISDMFVGFASALNAHDYATLFIQTLPKYYFDDTNTGSVGGNDRIQVFVITEDYEPESGWEAWSSDYKHISPEELMSMSISGQLNTLI